MSANETQNRKFAYMRKCLVKNKKLFLHALFSDNKKQTSARISVASPGQIKLLLRILFYLASGTIPIRGKDYIKIIGSRKLGALNKINEKRKLHSFLKSDYNEQVKFVRKFAPVFPPLLHSIFYD